MGEVLHAIDFDQLKIENQQYLAKIEERNSEMLKLKMSAGIASQRLNVYKKHLANLVAESDKLKQEIKAKLDLEEKLGIEIENVAQSMQAAEKTHSYIVSQTEEFRVPEVTEYVMEKAVEIDLKRQLNSWKRKVSVAEMSLEREKRILKSIVREDNSSPAPEIKAT